MGFITLFFLLVFLAIAVAVFRHQARRQRRRDQAMALAAQHLGGALEPGSFWRLPRIGFSYRGHDASIEYYSTGGKNPILYTRLFFRFSLEPPFAVRVYPERFFSRLGKLLGGQDLQAGDPLFDDKFMIKGQDQSRVLDFLGEEVRQAIFELRSLAMNDHIEISTEKNSLRIQKLSWLEAPDLIVKLAILGQRVFDGYLQASGLAAAPSPHSLPPAGRETGRHCAVCRDLIEGSLRACPRCGAPHHPECWQLNDGCGVCS